MGDYGPIQSFVERDVGDDDPAVVREVLGLWRRWAAGRWAPAWRSVDLSALSNEVLPYVVVCDVLEGGDYRFRYWGSGHRRYHPVDYSGKRLSSLKPDWLQRFLRMQYDRVVEERRPLLFLPKYELLAVPLYSLRLPLSDDGAKVSGLLGLAERKDVTEQLGKLMGRALGGEPAGSW